MTDDDAWSGSFSNTISTFIQEIGNTRHDVSLRHPFPAKNPRWWVVAPLSGHRPRDLEPREPRCAGDPGPSPGPGRTPGSGSVWRGHVIETRGESRSRRSVAWEGPESVACRSFVGQIVLDGPVLTDSWSVAPDRMVDSMGFFCEIGRASGKAL